MGKAKRFLALVLTLALLVTAASAITASAEENGDYKLLALTFDDGPSKFTADLLDGLAERGAYCTFFMTGRNISYRPELLTRMLEDGHQIANHSWDHPVLTAGNVSNQINSTRELLVAAGGEQTYYVRPPYGSTNKWVLAGLNAPAILWSVDPYDWKYPNAYTVSNNIISHARDGDIILLHDTHGTSCQAALIAIDALQAQGYEFVTVSELLRRRGITPENGVEYYCARNEGINLGPPVDPEYYDETELDRHWAWKSIQYVLENGLFSGTEDGSFLPNKKMTRGMFITVLGRLAGAEGTGGSPFSDVSSASYAAPYIAWAAENGIASGYGDAENRFGADDPVTREQMALMVLRYLQYAGYDTEGDGARSLSYSDAQEISAYAKDAVAVCTALGLLNGDGEGAFHPADFATRAQGASLFMRLHQYAEDHAAAEADTEEDTAENTTPEDDAAETEAAQ